ncbi:MULTISPECIES: DUF1071 domain-containing protein [unclassified Virgibacillus]|uniref:Sak single strand annealing protein n=1 Tax=unclassified Virgibacillus TaxID=2620237 RepID=UPI00090B2657|nr:MULTISPECIES: DUF1071 domain-containing protein [unclassified Virgibacillus]API92679.1 hypothetical protein BKP57_13215 [Virgibacillus sp. 6R]MBS7428173.1 DUF1071 domain-containing protein [Virgibacillus sp. 19R1-5]
MALKPFNELFNLDLSNEVTKRPVKKNSNLTLDYLEWANCIKLLYENGAESVRYGMMKNENHYPCFYNHNGESPFVSVWVEIDGVSYEEDYPVINGIYVVQNPNQLDINKAKQRGFVKAVAINTGLGLKLWIKEEELIANDKEIQKELQKSEASSLNDQITSKFARAMQKVGDKDTLYSIIQSSKEDMTKLYKSNDHASKKIVLGQLDVILNDNNNQ